MSPIPILQDDASYSVLASGTIRKTRAAISGCPASSSTDANTKTDTSSTALDYESYMSQEGLGRYPSPLKDLALRYLSIPGIINFGGGLPHPSTFPVSSLALTFPYHRRTITLDNTHASEFQPPAKPTSRSDLCLSSMMQYGGSSGSPVLRDYLKEHVSRTGGVGYKDWDLILTNGNTDGLDNIIRLLLPPRSSILLEAYAYPGTLAALAPLQINTVGIAMDSEGLVPSAMHDVLSAWDETARGTKRPRVVLIVPTGQNPTGATMGTQRRKDFYEVARKWHLIVICDDPYRSLRLHYPTTEYEAPSPAPPTFASLDTDGRVIELCSFSKMVAPGCRLGWILAPSALITKLSQRNEVTMQSVSGFSVAAMCAFLGAMDDGQSGFERYLDSVAQGYSKRAQLMYRLFQKHLPLDLVSYDLPTGGMFFFLNFSTDHPSLSPTALSQALFDRFIGNLIILTPSTVFRPDGGKHGLGEGEVWFRASFSFAGEEEMEEGARRLARAVRQVFGRE